MKLISVICTVAIFSVAKSGLAQGFANFNFEQASVVSAPPSYTPFDAYNPISSTNALPYWTVKEDGTVCTAIWGSPAALDETSVALVSAGSNPILGNYSVQLSAYADAISPYFRSSSISQTGLVPVGTQSIQFLITSPLQAGSVQPHPAVTLNGTRISLSEISTSGGVITMAGDVSAFAGTVANLTFLCEATTGGTFPANENYFNLDGVQFSSVPAPEPTVFALATFGALFLGFCRLRR